MYALSFIEAFRTVDSAVERALSLDTYRRTNRVRQIRSEAVAAVDDIAELATVAVTGTELSGYERWETDDTVESIVEAQIADRDDLNLDAEAVDRAVSDGRLVEKDGTVLVPLTEGTGPIRNWWLLADELRDWLTELIDDARRLHRRADAGGSDLVETAFWTLLDRLIALRELLDEALTMGEFVYRSTRRDTFEMLTDIGWIAGTITERTHA
ncbi:MULTISPECIES: hypothetical protein [Halorubrum]|jgi:hypothetical protein|uniref:hypothetical protein n=1 Tax=Halorubrum TaxID=56688 RepID=UPI000A2EAC6E|nr:MULTISPECIES: hypothetical protein [Halorubrum]MDB2226046.1 hypothetical protein [Halorubrum ezzemoulense]MDB2239320.1 hypothetical protein [Halorubrum ezzemoulense]MDB2249771.1 hypothetical protein [Halorubrum ezzemoulense]MDB2253305.1 hypothetical protein [Halorubrum ezzemoulense]OTE99905.1 hypothetical protein B9G49_09915 [Halorubrum sp. SD683]